MVKPWSKNWSRNVKAKQRLADDVGGVVIVGVVVADVIHDDDDHNNNT